MAHRRSGPKCGAICKDGETRCGHQAGHRTRHPGMGRCYLHGSGKASGAPSGAPKGNKRALKTGEFEKITESALSPEEQALWETLGQPNAKQQAVNALKLTLIREHRILIRLRYAEEGQDDDGMLTASITREDGWDGGKKYNTSVVRNAALATVMALEESLTRIAALKIRQIEQLRIALKDDDAGEDRLAALCDALDRSAALWAEEEEEAEQQG